VILVQSALAAEVSAGPASADSLRAAFDGWRQRHEAFDGESVNPPVVADYVEGLISARLGDTATALRLAGRLEATAGPALLRAPRELGAVVRAFAAFQVGQYQRALDQLDSAAGKTWLGNAASSPLDAQSFDRFIRAECLRAMGRAREAIAWYQTMEQYTVFDLAYLGVALRGEAAAYRALGEADAARAAEARLATLWHDADAEFAPQAIIAKILSERPAPVSPMRGR
jgi:tetratricopeptide (TPR) repeat protein